MTKLAEALNAVLRGGSGAAGSGDFLNDDPVFPGASSRGCVELDVHARRNPGLLLRSALEEIRGYLGSRGGVGSLTEAPKFLAYLDTVLNQRGGKGGIGLRTSRELRTIAEGLDALLSGDQVRAADLLVQRFKALEASIIDGNWSVARHMELIPDSTRGLTGTTERMAATRLELQRVKLQEAGKKR